MVAGTSPLAIALGLQSGDRILRVDGRPALPGQTARPFDPGRVTVDLVRHGEQVSLAGELE
jgi:hypothetical protein